MDMCERAARKGRVLVLVHRTELLDQHIEAFEKNGISTENILVRSVQSVYPHLDEYKDIYMVVADEAHLFKARTFEATIQHFRDRGAFVVGFTATPIRLDGGSLRSVFETMVVGPDTKWLIEHKRLCPYEYYAPLAIDIARLRKRAGDYVTEDVEALMEPAIYGRVIDEYKRLCPNKQAIAFCCSIKHSQQVAEQFRAAGIVAEHLDGNTPKRQRKAIMERFRAGEIQVLTNCSLISEGLSVDGVGAVLLLRPTMSLALHLQMIGRGLRYQEGKVCTIIDAVMSYETFGMPDSPRSWSLDAPPKAHKPLNDDGTLALRQCEYCFKVFKTAPKCPYCGFEYALKPRELKAIEDIELKRIEAEQVEAERARIERAKRDIRNARSYEELLEIAIRNGYKNPRYWARMRAKLRGYDKRKQLP